MRTTNQYLKHFCTNIDNDENFASLVEFYIAFSRFEFTLKITGHLKKNTNEAQPDWTGFGSKKKTAFDLVVDGLDNACDLKKAIDYILAHPPQKQIVGPGNNIVFKVAIDENPSKTQQLCTYITRIRNNLFHGAKFIDSNGDTSRDWELIRCALLVLSYWIEDDQNFNEWFFEG